MILILSNETDQSTNEVIDWIAYFKNTFLRINETDICEIEIIDFINNDNILIKVNDIEIKFDQIESYWYRRGDFNIRTPLYENSNTLSKEISSSLSNDIDKNLKRELGTLIDYLHIVLKKKNGIGSYFDNYTNKLHNLLLAKQCGLLIPSSIISSNKDRIVEFIESENEIITKAISETIMFSVPNEGSIQSYTSIVGVKEIQSYKTFLFPSLFQNNIKKRYELRIFYLDGTFYTMAIFSQMSKTTMIDFRNYNRVKPNRCVPYILPEIVKLKLDCFMKQNGLKTGSIDMIVDEHGEYIFLEVNPVGQYGMISYPCNYYLDKKIAEYLCARTN